MSVAVADEPAALDRFIDRGLEHPSARDRIGLRLLQDGADPATAMAKSDSKKTCVGDVPLAINV